MTSQDTVAADFRWQADACRALGSRLYGELLDRCAADVEAGGPTAVLLADHLDYRRRDAVPLRLLAGVHALVLSGRAPQLAAYYPSAGGGATGDETLLWSRFRQVLVEHSDEVRPWLDHAPQTNEVGRAAALAGGLCHLAAAAQLPVRLVEIGTSAGLNLRADVFRIDGSVATRGPASSPVRLRGAWLGVAPPDVHVDVAERVGIDIAPIDPTTPDGRLRLAAFVWPDQQERLERLYGAIEIASRTPAELRQQDAIDAVRGLTPVEGTWTVLWHSVFRQYLSSDGYAELADAITSVGRVATAAAPFAHLTLEPEPGSPPGAFPVTLTTWPTGQRRILGTAPAHGMPVTWTT